QGAQRRRAAASLSEVAIFGPPLPPISFRPRRAAVVIGALAALALLFGLHVYHWHAPYRLEGIVGELPLLASALVAGGIAGLALPRFWPRLARARTATGALAALVAFVALQAADPFVARRDWRYAPEDCDFAVAFPRRPEIVAGEARLAGMRMKTVTRALLTDVGAATTLSAECLDFERAIADADKDAVLAAIEAQLKAAAARLRLKLERVAREGDTVVLAGFSDEGRNAANEPLLRHAEARAMLGQKSLLVLWAWKIGRAGESMPFGGEFFAGVRRARTLH
ncbi:MAG TPA: hypothetical protein VIF14_18590, partial [Alphaproteobacteria bacterium]